jgi:1,4-alpha-glucan branching enzyme
MTIAEESSDWPKITHPVWNDGYGFGMKWMMGWMHDMFRYFKKRPEKRLSKQNDLTFSMMYFYNEKFMLPLSHDEVVHGKSPMIYKMPGNDWEKFANLRLLYSFMWFHPGGKLLFMGNEFGQTQEWNYKVELQWDLLQHDSHKGMQATIIALNKLLKTHPALYELQFENSGFEWLSLDNRKDGIIVFARKSENPEETILVVMNVSNIGHNGWPVKTFGYKLNEEIFNSKNKEYWGRGLFQNPGLNSKLVNRAHKQYETKVEIPPLSLMAFNVLLPSKAKKKPGKDIIDEKPQLSEIE